MKNSIEILKGVVNKKDLDDYDHLEMLNYLKIINSGICTFSNNIFNKNKSNPSTKRLVAARCDLEFKNELLIGNNWILYMSLKELNNKYLNFNFKIISNKQIKARAKMVLVVFDIYSRKSVTLNSQEIKFLKDYFN